MTTVPAIVLLPQNESDLCRACTEQRGLCGYHARLIGRLAQVPWHLIQGMALIEQTQLQDEPSDEELAEQVEVERIKRRNERKTEKLREYEAAVKQQRQGPHGLLEALGTLP